MLNWDTRRNVMIGGSYDQTLEYCAEQFIKICEESIEKFGSFTVALSGGSTPKALYTLLSKPPYSTRVDWSKVYLFWSDERAVEMDDDDSNYNMAMKAGFSKLSIPENHIYRMKAEKNIEAMAHEYEKLIETHLKGRGFDLVMLGMGEDGHTASLFPKTEGLHATQKRVIANFIPQKECWRMSLTFACINEAPTFM